MLIQLINGFNYETRCAIAGEFLPGEIDEQRHNMARLAGKVALISDAAHDQGAGETQLFARQGAQVVCGDILDDEGKQIESAIRAQGGIVTYVHLDVTREADWQHAVQTAESQYGKLNILVNNAGIVMRGLIEESSEDDWERLMAINMKGCFCGQSMPSRPCGGQGAELFMQ
jgi:3alpha(or 20beta)-hydroxysteroid dehydrogenase